MSVSKFAFILLLTALFTACQSEPQQQTSPSDPDSGQEESPETTRETEPGDETQAYKTAIADKLRAYYDDLEQEQMDESNYFAPVVEAFYSQKNQNREKIGEIIRSGFEGIIERKIVLDERSFQFSEQENGYVLEFEGFAEVKRKGETESKTERFHNRFVFDKDYHIVEYGPALQPKNVNRESAPQQAAAGSVKDLLKALSALDYDKADAFIHPEFKLRYLTRPGAYDVIYVLKSLREVAEYSPWMADAFKGINCEPVFEAIPDFDCDDFDKQGCFMDKVEGYDRLVDNMQALAEAELNTFTQSQLNDATEVQQYVQVQLTHTAQTIALFFGNIDGKWYLLVLDRAIYDCSA
jgi:hypothetical protein